MRPQFFDFADVSSETDASTSALPLRSRQGAATAPSLMSFVLLSLLAAAVVLPQLGLAGYALLTPDIRQMIADRPLVAFQVAVAMLFWVALFAWPIRGLFARLTWRRNVEITSENVAVSDTRPFGDSQWTAPLSAYKGVAHHIRSSLSGTRQELVLVHPDSRRSVLLMTAPLITEADIAAMTRLLGRPQIAASELYPLAKRSPADPSLTWSAVPA